MTDEQILELWAGSYPVREDILCFARALLAAGASEVQADLLGKLLSHAWEVDVKWNKEPNTIRRIVIDVRDTATAGQHHIDHAKALIAEFCKTAASMKEPK